MAVLGELMEGLYELSGGLVKELSKRLKVVLLTSAPVGVFLERKSTTRATQASSVAKARIGVLTVAVLEVGSKPIEAL